MLRRSTSLVGIPDLPEDYELRQYRVDDEVAYKDLFNLGFAGDRLGHTLTHTLDDGFFVIDHTASRQVVASCVALRGSWDDGRERGILGWLIVDPSHTRLGLGTIVAAKVTNRLMEEGYSEPGLGTEDFRLTAIGIYLKLGWRPYLYMEDMDHRWRETCERLGRRLLREECVES
ncbi:MAG: GNAT family N-acetyltransferase [Dehalococcoidia bacterium]|nr:GNAT family N-acetyltransferase [Dehalococcoidia bacterium]